MSRDLVAFTAVIHHPLFWFWLGGYTVCFWSLLLRVSRRLWWLALVVAVFWVIGFPIEVCGQWQKRAQ